MTEEKQALQKCTLCEMILLTYPEERRMETKVKLFFEAHLKKDHGLIA